VKLPLANGKYREPAKILVTIFAWSGLAFWIFHLYLFLQYDATRPRQLDRPSGRIYAQMNHGHVVYLTKAEDARLTEIAVSSLGLAGAAFLVGVLFAEKTDWKGKTPAPWEKKQW
jgi:hypothetical protein